MSERIAEAWVQILPESHREASHAARCIITDQFFEDIRYEEMTSPDSTHSQALNVHELSTEPTTQGVTRQTEHDGT